MKQCRIASTMVVQLYRIAVLCALGKFLQAVSSTDVPSCHTVPMETDIRQLAANRTKWMDQFYELTKLTDIDTYVRISLGECVWIFAHHVGQMTHSHPIFGFCFSHHFIVFLGSLQIRFGRFAQLYFGGVGWIVIIRHEFHTALHHCAIIASSPILQQTTG